MNEMEHQLVDKTLESIHQLEMKVVEMQGELRAMREHSDTQHKSLSEKIEKSIQTDNTRLNKHSSELDDHSGRLATLEEWKKQFEVSVKNRLTISQSISTVVAVVIAFLLSKFFI